MTPAIDPGTAMGPVRLRVGDLEDMRGFYERAIGLEALEGSGSLVRMGVADTPLVDLVGDADAQPRPRRSTGLFHLAILVADRPRLGAALRRLADADWGLTGASDHLVSEALYTSDPEGNGIEIYRDRARDEWPSIDGELQMDTLPLDVSAVLEQADPDGGPMDAATRMGHVHLNVADIRESDDFYCGVLGFQATIRSYPGALFVAAGGYHHHLGLNTWTGEGAPAPPAGSRGLERFEVVVPAASEVDAIAGRLEGAGVAVDRVDGGIEVSDPSSNRAVIRA